MPNLTVYHCSPDRILDFNFETGVHFGGIYSAFEAAFRKLDMLRLREDVDQEFLYLHTCTLNVDYVYDCEDVGCFDSWLKKAKEARERGFDVLRYENKYEPDTEPSYYVLNKNLINLECIEVISEDVVLDTLDNVEALDQFYPNRPKFA